MNKENGLKKLGLISSFAIYIPAALLMYFLTKYLIPYLSEITGLETILFWFIVAASGIFFPLIITAIMILKFEGLKISKNTWIQRLRFRKITKKDILWSIGGLILVGIISVIIMKGLELVIGKFDHSPAFMSFEPLTKGRYWLLLVWFPYWILNILGEEILWRGVMLPRQETAFGKYAWVIHGFGWGLFHIAFGWQLLITLIPLIFIQSYVVQRTKNSWTGVIMHGGLNGPSFIAISFGLV
ncbi:MAG: CPBP family intramembrane metalloprotease [Bacteroidales bacterium]|nr:CPBP family intramembrane metalloprotease [Bacteroidales bacterium]